MTGRRTVRATTRFFEDLDRQLAAERGANGEPSANDFLVHDLLRIVERFAVAWEDLPELFVGRPQYRILVGSGTVVIGFAVIGQLAADGAVELVQLDIDTESSW